MNSTKMFLAVALLVAAQNTSTSAQSPVSPSGVPKTDEYSKLVDEFGDKCVSGNCVNGKGKMVYRTGDTYEGDFVNGKHVGHGTYTFKNGQVYVGQFSDNLRNGKGRFTFSDGSVYEGSFVNDNFIGHGTYISKSGSNQTGKFTVGQIVDLRSNLVDTYWGKAEILEILSDRYKVRDLWFRTTEIVTAQRIRPFTPPVKYEIGQKVEVMDKGVWYKGEIIGNEVAYNDHYRIRFERSTGRPDLSESVRYLRPGIASSNAQTPSTSKCLSGNCLNGFGKYLFANGNTYEGNFVNGRGNGKGKVVNTDGSSYVGDFVNGKMEGRGIFLSANGNTYNGLWANNVRSGLGKETIQKSGEFYNGQFAHDKRNGKGIVKYQNGDIYDGDWVNGLREGQATYTFKNGSYYIGGFVKDKQEGFGKQFNKLTNNMTEGTWKNGSVVNVAGAVKIVPADSGPKSPVVETKTLLRETLNGKFDYFNREPLKYIYTNKKTGEVLRYQIEFIEDGGKLSFRWKESTKNEQSGKLVITDEAIRTATKFVNFFSTKTAIAADKEIAFILSQNLHKAVKNKDEISLDLGGGVKRLSYIMQFTASSGTYTDKNIKVLHYKANDDITKVQILDDPICPLIVKIETAEYTLALV
ncbi:MAG: hypothetical protein KBF83_07720 [Pyrinomonadaceae bacterium]|nr:hypothetical protein [Pyrinomonadaceae bacterium]MBP9109428.1 hypothetical protein [Pyrinomonadaceae bacterium]